MKRKINILLVFLLAFAVLFTGCKKQDESSGDLDKSDEIAQEVEQEEPVVEEDPVVDEEPAVEEEPAVDEEPAVEEQPVIDEEATVKDQPVIDEEATVKDQPAVEEKPKDQSKPAEAKAEEPKQEEKPVDERKNTLKVQGNVSNELSLSLAELQDYTDIGFSGTYYSLNSFGTTQHTDFKGVNLWLLLKDKAGISDSATTVKVIAVDGYEMQFSIAQVKRSDYIDETDQDVKLPVIIAWQENGEDYSINDGPPYKLVIGQKEPGDVNKPQWVSNIDKIIVE